MPSYSLTPSFDCPFGWPKQPNYPIDLLNLNQEKLKEELDQESNELNIFNSIYLKALYQNYINHQNIQSFSINLRSYQHEFDPEELIQIYQSFLIPEHLLVKKWSEEIKKIANNYQKTFITNFNLDQIQNHDEIFHLNEPELIHQTLTQFYSNNNQESNNSISNPKDSFIKSNSISKQLEIWSLRETQLQIILLLEVIILTNLTLESGSQFLFHHKQLTSSPRKSRVPHHDKQGREEKQISENELNNDQVFADLELALEGLIDRLAMWQIISGIENNLTSNNKTCTTSNTTIPPHSSVSNPDLLQPSNNMQDLDHVQRFWTEVVEKNYTEHLPLLNRSFRPKLFPTSIYDPLASSSIIPTKFEATMKPSQRDIESSILSSITRTPNLKRLERRKNREKPKKEINEMNINLMSPTMIELNGLRKPKTNISKTHSKIFQRSNSSSTNQINNTNNNSKNITSKSLFNRRQVKMSKVPSKSKLPNSNQSSVCFKSNTTTTTTTPLLSHPVNCKRKQSSPKRNHETFRTELITTTPRKLNKFNDLTNNNKNNPLILVPDTPQTTKQRNF